MYTGDRLFVDVASTVPKAARKPRVELSFVPVTVIVDAPLYETVIVTFFVPDEPFFVNARVALAVLLADVPKVKAIAPKSKSKFLPDTYAVASPVAFEILSAVKLSGFPGRYVTVRLFRAMLFPLFRPDVSSVSVTLNV